MYITLWTEFNPESNTKAWKILEDLEKEILTTLK